MQWVQGNLHVACALSILYCTCINMDVELRVPCLPCPAWPQRSYQSTGLPSAAAMQLEYSQIAQALGPFVDVFVAETLSTVAEAHAALQATAQLGESGLFYACFSLKKSFAGSSLCMIKPSSATRHILADTTTANLD